MANQDDLPSPLPTGSSVSNLDNAVDGRGLSLESTRFVVQRSTETALLLMRHPGGPIDRLEWSDGMTADRPKILTDGGRESDDFVARAERGNVPEENKQRDRTVATRKSNTSLGTGATAERTRQRLKRAFDHHLHRVVKGETAHVAIRVATPQSPGTYRYLDNGSDRGGAHYFSDLTQRTKNEIISCASAAGLTVLIEGTRSVSVSFETEAVENDVRFAETVLVTVFDASVADIISIEEVIDGEESREWLY